MTEFEMATLHSELFMQAQTSQTVFLTVLSGVLVVSYFAAHRLTWPVICVGGFVFLAYSVLNIFGAYRTLQTYADLSLEMRSFAQAGRGLSWHGAIDLTDAMAAVLPVSAVVLSVSAIVGSLIFFFHCRRINRAIEARPAIASPAAQSPG